MLLFTFELFFQNLTQCALPQRVSQQAATPSTTASAIFLFFSPNILLNIISMEVRDKKLKNTLKDCKKPNILVKPERGKSLKK